MKELVLFFGVLLVSLALYAENSDLGGSRPDSEPLESFSPSETKEKIEPEVTIIRKEDATIEEYRLNGFLYMIKVTPTTAPPYYLIDNDGDGSLETRRRELDGPVVPQWILFTW